MGQRFPAEHGIFQVYVFSLLFARGRYYKSPEWVWKVLIKNTDQEDAETSGLICMHMHMKNNVIINSNRI